MSDEMKEFATFTVTTKSGDQVELAVVDEFRYEGKDYVAGALILEDDTISDEGVYLYKAKVDDDGNLIAEKIRDFDYERIVKAYQELQEEE